MRYTKQTPVVGSSRAFRKFAKRGGNPFALQRALGMSKELGFVDTAVADYAMDTTGSVTLIPTIAQGTSVNQRVGKKIHLKGLQCRGLAFSGTTASFNDCGYIIVYDKRPTGALPAVTDILVSVAATSMNNDANAGRFSVLKREDLLLIGANAAGERTDCTCASADWYLDLKGREVVYKAAATGAIGDIEQGAIYLVTFGANVAGTTAATLRTAFRTRFLDV